MVRERCGREKRRAGICTSRQNSLVVELGIMGSVKLVRKMHEAVLVRTRGGGHHEREERR